MKSRWTVSFLLGLFFLFIIVACISEIETAKGIPGPTTSPAATLHFLGNKKISPVIYLDGTTPSGVAVDIVNALARHMSQLVEKRAMDWSDAQTLVAQREADALIQINSTDEQKKIYKFSDLLLEYHFSIFVRTEKMGTSGHSGLRGLLVGVESGGLPQQLTQKDPQIQMIIIPNFLDGFHQLNKEKSFFFYKNNKNSDPFYHSKTIGQFNKVRIWILCIKKIPVIINRSVTVEVAHISAGLFGSDNSSGEGRIE
jgi:ABC-type amino acid transport substrate-binding protein